MAEAIIEICADVTGLKSTLSELDLYVSQLPAEIRQRLLGLLDSPAKIFRTENRPAAVGTVLTVFFEPTDLLLDLLSACRTGDFKNLIIEGEPLFHG